MAQFGFLTFPHVLRIETQKTRVEIERNIPYRGVPYRIDNANLGQTVLVTGEIRVVTISDAFMAIEQFRVLNDGQTRLCDLQDGTTPSFNAKLVDPDYSISVDGWFPNYYRVAYSVTFLEVA